jgi:hypothetical protein
MGSRRWPGLHQRQEDVVDEMLEESVAAGLPDGSRYTAAGSSRLRDDSSSKGSRVDQVDRRTRRFLRASRAPEQRYCLGDGPAQAEQLRAVAHQFGSRWDFPARRGCTAG